MNSVLKTKTQILIILFLVLSNFNLLSQQKNLKFKHISLEEGLLHSDVQKIIQDKKGFIWIATEDALSKYDGYDLKHFRNNPDDSLSISSNRIRDIVENKEGDLWIATEGGGLNKFIRNTEQFIKYKHDPKNNESISDDIIKTLFLAKDGQLWIGTNKGLCLLEKEKENDSDGQFIKYDLSSGNNKEAQVSIRCIYEDSQNYIWVGTAKGLFRINNSDREIFSFTNIPSDKNSLINNSINTIYEDNKNHIWIGTENGISIYSPEKKSFENIPFVLKKANGLPNKFIISITQDLTGNIWVGSNNGLSQLIRGNNSDFNIVNYQSNPLDLLSINSNIVQCLYSDNSGILWIGTREGGINILDFSTQKFKLFNNQSGKKIKLIANSIWSFHEENNELWVGARGGLNRIDLEKNDIQYYTHNPNDSKSIGSNNVFDVRGYNGDIWVALFGTGISKFNKATGKFTNYRDKEHGIRSTVDLFINKKGDFLVGSFGEGLSKFDPKSGKYSPIAINAKNVTDILESSSGNYWVGTDSKGILWLDENFKTIEHFKNAPGVKTTLINNTIWGICESDGFLYLATSGGLEKLKIENQKVTITHYLERDGLSSNLVYSVTNDNQGNLWLGTSKGLCKFNPKNETFKSFDVKDGLQSNEFNAGAVFKNSKGELYFGGINGFNKFNPEELVDNKLVPKVYLTNFKIANKRVPVKTASTNSGFALSSPISELNEIKLNYKQSFFSFEFVALNYKQSSKNLYAFYLEGFEDDWNYSQVRREAFYTNVPPGEYTFRVKAANNDGVWNEKGVSLNIIITPPFWETLWFKILAAFIIAGTSIGYYKYRLASIKRQNRRLEMKVIVRTKEIAAQKDEIESQAEELQQQAEELQQQRDHLSEANNAISLKNNEISQRLEDIKELSVIGQKVTATIEINEIISRVYENLNKLMDAPNFELGIINQKSDNIEYLGFHDRGEKMFTAFQKINKENSLTSYCIKNKEIVFIGDLEKDISKFISDKESVLEYQEGKAKSIVYIPLILEEKIIGVLIVRSFKINAYNEVYVDILKNLGSYISIALDNAKAYSLVEQKKQHITDSINAALSIQQAILPNKEVIKKLLNDHFIIYRPKDIVSGDFYWINEVNNKVYLAVVDCTGHGVPGAFMSMIGNSLLNRIIIEKGIYEPSEILEQLDVETKNALKHDQKHNREGMDIGICTLDYNHQDNVQIAFSGAKISLFYILNEKNKKLNVLAGNRRSIGNITLKKSAFIQHNITLNKEDQFYLTTDGIIDQNNILRKRLGSKYLKETLLQNAHFSITEQGEKLEKVLDTYQDKEFQRDDITLIGVKI